MPTNWLKMTIRNGACSKNFKGLIGVGLVIGIIAVSLLFQTTTQPTLGKGRKSGFEMVHVHRGTFIMGNTGGDEDEKPPHQVTLSDFQIGKYEITQADWSDIVGTDPPGLHFKGCDQCPVEIVSWHDAQTWA